MAVTFYHNPQCSKSRAALALLRERGVEPEIVEYLKTPPSEAELGELLQKLKLEAVDIIRKNEAPYKELQLGRDSVTEVELIAAIAKHPILLQRPIAVSGPRAVIGRPPERVLELL